jgi:NADH dehydrogenase (ubiquinone) flavoprotein 1
MMNMMDRMVEGRAHSREIDMLLELTKQVCSSWPSRG